MVGGDGDELVLFDDVGREVVAVDAACVRPYRCHRTEKHFPQTLAINKTLTLSMDERCPD